MLLLIDLKPVHCDLALGLKKSHLNHTKNSEPLQLELKGFVGTLMREEKSDEERPRGGKAFNQP